MLKLRKNVCTISDGKNSRLSKRLSLGQGRFTSSTLFLQDSFLETIFKEIIAIDCLLKEQYK